MIGIFHGGRETNTGPGKVAINLINGLKKIGHSVLENQEGDMTGCLAAWSPRFKDLPSNTLVGPNIMVFPTDDVEVWDIFNHYITPSKWVEDYFKTYELSNKVNMHIWAVGVDTDHFAPRRGVKSKCLVYHKRGKLENLQDIIFTLDRLEIEYELLSYGSYTEEDLITACSNSLFAILNTDTESQGIAYQEILSMGVPCYVVDKTIWDYDKDKPFPATSAPYFDKRCGIKHKNLSRLAEFLDCLNGYKPREYILDNLTLEKCASEYVKLLEVSHER